jgi:phospholipid/cholesterol/gamma-HCH transport system substrate-binding protein
MDYFMKKDKIILSSEIYDFNAVNDVRGNNPHLNLTAKYIYLKHLEFLTGFENILNSKAASFFLGLGIKFRDNDIKTLVSGGATSFLK